MSNNVWYSPDAWAVGLTNKTRFNKQIENNIRYLFEKNISTVQERNGTNSTSGTPIASTTLTTTGGNVRISFKGSAEKTGVGDDIYFDVTITLGGGAGTRYASTGTGTPASRGVAYARQGTAGFRHAHIWSVIVPNIPAGTHTFQLTMASSAGTPTLVKANTVTQFIVEEYGLGQTNLHTWHEPKSWNSGENVTIGKLNKYVKDRTQQLYDRNYVYANPVYGASLTTVSTTFVTIDSDGLFKLHLKTEGNDVNLSFLATMFTVSVNGSFSYLDFKVDDDYFVSSLTSTALSDGCFNAKYNASQPMGMYFNVLVRDLDAGWHSFEPFFKTSSAGSAAAIAFNSQIQFVAEEYCLTS